MSILTMSITEQVTNAIREAIVTGEYEPGQKLSEAFLSEHFKVSRTPIREALKQLEREGLVEIIPRVGSCVTKPTDRDLTELFTVKEVMEGLAAGLLAESGDTKYIEMVKESVTSMEQAVKTNDHKLYVESNNIFHKAILDGANNSKLSYLLNLLLNQIPYSRYVYLSIEVPNRLEKSLQEHQEILEAILLGDRTKAEQVMRDHVRASGVQLKKGIYNKLYDKKQE
ncbi:GntR family transcriptional regulator [Bacillus sp. JJ1521]|uniref:GntR family transcriptional regulator n=1 Tax=Bacillus sp. JJ1521 TaxID=3122957 RepID=UPI002FFD90A1